MAGIQPEEMTRAAERFLLYRSDVPARVASFADDVRFGLSVPEKSLSPKYFYDDLGSALFEAICLLPEYELTRTETEILRHFSGEIVSAVGAPLEIVELGSGSGIKTRLIIEAALARQRELAYHPVDISLSALQSASTALLADFEGLSIAAYAADYFDVLEHKRIETRDPVLVLFLGSNIGNYEPDAAIRLLRAVSSSLAAGDAMLVGADMKRDPAAMVLGYDDPTGVTAAFNKNLLGRINRELGGRFDQRTFGFEAHYNESLGRIESFLRSERAQTVRIDGLDIDVEFREGERIHTESSYKFSRHDLERLANASGFRLGRIWTDRKGRFTDAMFHVR